MLRDVRAESAQHFGIDAHSLFPHSEPPQRCVLSAIPANGKSIKPFARLSLTTPPLPSRNGSDRPRRISVRLQLAGEAPLEDLQARMFVRCVLLHPPNAIA